MLDAGFVQVILPLRLSWNPWYKAESALRIGQRVAVTFARKSYIGVVCKLSGEASPDSGLDPARIQHVDNAETGLADVSLRELELWNFVASYYMCTLGEVYKAAYPLLLTKSEIVAVRKAERAKNAKRKKKLAPAPPPKEHAVQSELDLGTKPVLVRGVERMPLYIKAIRRELEAGRNVLVLEPESEFVQDMAARLSREFASSLLVYDSSCTTVARRKVLEALRAEDGPYVLVGMRSAVFLPYAGLGLVIVDEEHDASYKQSESSPTYNGRDVAAVMASAIGAQLILGSCCPSLESLYNCHIGKWSLHEAPSASKSEVEIIEIPAEWRKRGMVDDFSRKAIAKINACQGLVSIVRCYRTEEQVAAQVHELFPKLDPQILTAAAARKNSKRCALTLVMNADALFDRSDFRADEKALQLLASLKAHTDVLLVQCGAANHPVYRALQSVGEGEAKCGTGERSAGRTGLVGAGDVAAGRAGLVGAGELMAEREAFGLPPFSRIVDICDPRTGSLVKREILPKDSTLASRKTQLQLEYGAAFNFNVDPL